MNNVVNVTGGSSRSKPIAAYVGGAVIATTDSGWSLTAYRIRS